MELKDLNPVSTSPKTEEEKNLPNCGFVDSLATKPNITCQLFGSV